MTNLNIIKNEEECDLIIKASKKKRSRLLCKEINIIENDLKLKYNNNTYCVTEPNTEILIKYKQKNDYIVQYLWNSYKKNNYRILFSYKKIEIELNINNSFEILLLYVILQYHYSVKNIHEFVNIQKWNYNLWNVSILELNNKKLPDHLILLNCFLNLKDRYNTPIEILELEIDYKLEIKDKRGLGGERPRELNYKYGYPYFTSITKKYLNKNQRIFICPFPIETINPQRKAIIECNIICKCFTCGLKENEIDKFGKLCKFEKGHLIPVKYYNNTKSYWQCKWCNTFYKDKIIWNEVTNKPEFNYYGIIRDMKKSELLTILKQFGITSSDLSQ